MSCPSFHRPLSCVHGLSASLHGTDTSSKTVLHTLQPLRLRLLHRPCASSVQECEGYHCIEHLNFCPPLYPTLPPQPLGQHVVGLSCLCYPRVNHLLHVIVGCDDSAQIGKGRDILKSITFNVDVLRGNTGIRHCTHHHCLAMVDQQSKSLSHHCKPLYNLLHAGVGVSHQYSVIRIDGI